jgi:hypothetical protein
MFLPFTDQTLQGHPLLAECQTRSSLRFPVEFAQRQCGQKLSLADSSVLDERVRRLLINENFICLSRELHTSCGI